MKKSKGLTFFLSFVPGLGHFYLNQMNRGLQFMLIFSLAIFFAEAFILFGFFIPIIWFYSLFDALQQRNRMEETKEIQDKPIIKWQVIENKKYLLGWGMILLGAFYLLEKVAGFYFNWEIYQIAKNILIGAVIIFVGLRLVSGKGILPNNQVILQEEKVEGELGEQ